ncbi:MAG TPA: LutB/LldF family L-lactate oxidation iron-sulfur protein [Pyrinomonadaceae bacterium]|nr:LutB/LldF family L-lactate oxidation iron-sulfur protein [Pyrinomonadaceae bacterium]
MNADERGSMNHLSSETFKENARAALADVHLRGALKNATTLFGERRKEAAASLPNWEDLRSQARAIKDEALLHLDRYLEEFVRNAESRGALVHWARDGAEANTIICTLAKDRGARTVVKSKSMTTEETHLNDALEAAGMQVVETDLGEYIIQLAEETPSHIIAPAIHKTRGQIAELFTAELGMPPTDDVAQLTSTARATLRDRFAAADVGISGVNFGIAESGTIVIVENEGNIRLTTSLPRMHIAVMGIEKVVPSFADLDVFLKLLPRSGTGQRLTTYQSFITGTKRRATDEGPDELHIVLLDNGRSRMLAHPVTRQSLACIRCGACLNACPVYQQIGGHAYGSVYPGPIGAVITPQLMGIEKTAQLPYASSLCGACREVCPVKIDIPRLLLHLRGEITAQRKGNTAERLAFKLWARVMMSKSLYKMSAVVGRLLQHVVPISRAWTSGRDLRPIESRSFHDRWKTLG